MSTLPKPWHIVFDAALSGSREIAPADGDPETALKRMAASIREGKFKNLIPFDEPGQSVF